jgi:hypothetical protein
LDEGDVDDVVRAVKQIIKFKGENNNAPSTPGDAPPGINIDDEQSMLMLLPPALVPPEGIAKGSGAKRRLPEASSGDGCYSTDEASALKPLGPAYKLYPELKWHTRWRAEFKGKRTSIIDTGSASEKKAFSHCLRFL